MSLDENILKLVLRVATYSVNMAAPTKFFLSLSVLALFLCLLRPVACHGHGHSHDEPTEPAAFKYSRAANEAAQKAPEEPVDRKASHHGHSHDHAHSHGHGHQHDHHGHAHHHAEDTGAERSFPSEEAPKKGKNSLQTNENKP